MEERGITIPAPPVKCGIFIGINKVLGLTPLTGAAENASQMNTWAQKQGFNTRLFTDAEGPVLYRSIFDGVKELLKNGPQQFVMYFAGHGYLRAAGTEIWLLSEALENPAEAIDLLSSKVLAQEFGITNVVFISDACRSIAGSHQQLMVSGNSIFPIGGNGVDVSRVDVLFATRPGSPAHEVRDAEGIYHGIYTECLLECLKGEVRAIVKELNSMLPPIMAVVSYDLNEYLEVRIPELSIERRLPFVQRPAGEVTSREPIYISRVGNVSYANLDARFNLEMESSNHGEEEMEEDNLIKGDYHSKRKGKTLRQQLEDFKLIHDQQDDVLADIKRNLEITYALANDNFTNNYQNRKYNDVIWNDRQFLEGNYLEVKGLEDYDLYTSYRNVGDDESNGTVIIQPAINGNGIPIALIENYKCAVAFYKGELISLDYIPIAGHKQYEYASAKEEIVERKSKVITAAKFGLFEGNNELAFYLRNFKSLDPTLGLFAAYAYMQTGNRKGVVSIFNYMVNEPEPILFDVAMLRYIAAGEKVKKALRRASFVPLLTQGWSYLPLVYEGKILELTRELVPGLWTTFTKAGLSYLENHFNFKKR